MPGRRPTREEKELLMLYRECSEEWREFVVQTAILAASQREQRAEILSIVEFRRSDGKGTRANQVGNSLAQGVDE